MKQKEKSGKATNLPVTRNYFSYEMTTLSTLHNILVTETIKLEKANRNLTSNFFNNKLGKKNNFEPIITRWSNLDRQIYLSRAIQKISIKSALIDRFQTNKIDFANYAKLVFQYTKRTMIKVFLSYSIYNTIIFLLNGSNLVQCNLLLRHFL